MRVIPTFLFYSTLTIEPNEPPAPEKFEIGQSYRSIAGYRSGNQNHRKKYTIFWHLSGLHSPGIRVNTTHTLCLRFIYYSRMRKERE